MIYNVANRSILLLCLIILCCGSLRAQRTAKFNFSASAATVSGWTNIHGDPSVSKLSATSNGITVSSDTTVNWVPLSGTGSAFDGIGVNTNGFFPGGVLVNHWFQATSLGQYNVLVPQLLISGLNPDSVYQLKMTGSSTSANNTNPTQYTVAGQTIYGYIQVNTHNNTASGATFNNIAPDANGVIRVYVNTVSTTNVADICGIQIVEGHTNPGPTVAFTNIDDHDIITENAFITIDASASEAGGTIVKVQFFVGDTIKIGESTTAPYSAVWEDPDLGSYKLTVTAVDANGVSNSTSINVTVESLSSFWSMTGNIHVNADTEFLGTVDTNRLAIRTNNIERVSVLGDGTVGIGTRNTFGYKLAVNGSAIFTKVRIRAYNLWPDYVFKKEYKLPGLDSLDRYISIHRHLPGIIPAGKAAREGIDMGDNQALLLKKIEELTLYLIQEHKEVKRLSEEVRQLRKQNEQLKTKTHPAAR